MNKKLIDEIKMQYPSLQKWSDTHAFELYKKIQEHQLITEFLSTVNAEKTIQSIERLQLPGIEANSRDGFIFVKFEVLRKEYLDKINKEMDVFGWYPSYVSDTEGDGRKYSTGIRIFINDNDVIVKYEAKYDEQIDVQSKYAYHLTPDIKWPKIKTLGLTPKTQGKLGDHPGRVYLLSGMDNLEDFKIELIDIGDQLLSSYKNNNLVKEMYLLRIDLSKVKNIKFFKDPNFFMGDAVWTYENIPPYAINVIGRIKK
jgi:hypothetical protein